MFWRRPQRIFRLMKDKLILELGDLVELQGGVMVIVVNIWEFGALGRMIAVMIDGQVKVVPVEEIIRVVSC